jgi:cytochrome c oxidase subunit 2
MSKVNRRHERTPVVWMVIHGIIASAVGIAAGLSIHWFPTQASTQAGPIDHLWDVLIVLSVPVFVTVMIIVLFSVVNFRMRPGEEELDGPPIHGNTRLEIIWTAIPAIMLVALCSYAYIVLTDIEQAHANEMTITVTGQQFAWSYEYPQASGQPVKSNILYLPKDQPIRFNVKALDVIHDFWVPDFRMKVDAVPGITTHYRITPDRLGTYPVVCAELCGLGHSVMRSTTKVIMPAAFKAWLAKQKAPGAPAAGAAAPPAAGAPAAGQTAGAAPAGDPTAGKAVFAANGCGGCHTLADAGATGTVGPDLGKVLKGKDAKFVSTSITDPGADIAPGFKNGIMPTSYGANLSPQDLANLVAYLEKVAAK